MQPHKKKSQQNQPTIITLLDTPAFGGAEQYVLDCSEILHQHGHKVLIFTNNAHVTERYLKYKKKKKLVNFEVRKLPYLLDAIGNWKGLLKFFFHAPRACVWFYRTLRQIKLQEQQQENKVLCLFVGFSDRLLFSPLVKFLRTPLIWIEFGPLPPVFKRNWGFPKLLYMLTKRYPDHHITTSKYTRSTMVTNGGISPHSISLVYPGVNLFTKQEVAKLKTKGEKIRKKITQAEILIGFVGRMATETEVDVLIRAFATALPTVKKSMHLVLMGDGPEKNRFEKLAKKLNVSQHCTFTGFVSTDQKFSTLAASDIFVFPRAWSWEGFGITTIEALSVETAVITPKFGPQKEIVTHMKNGLNFKAHDHSTLALQIIKLAGSKKLRSQLAHAGFKTVNKQFTSKLMEESLLRAVNRVTR